MSPLITYVTSCKGRLPHLKETLPRVAAQAMSCVVVDYSCPEGTAAWVERNYPQVTVVRVAGQTGFSAARARNAGAAVASTPWLLFADADILLAPNFTEAITGNLIRGKFYRALPVTPQTWGTIVCGREDFIAAGGYDEVYEGWGGEDDDLVGALLMMGRRQASFPAALVAEIAHPNADRTRFHEISDLLVQQLINHTYMRAKFDLWRLVGKPLPIADRKVMYDKIKRAVLMFDERGRSTPLVIDLAVPPVVIQGPADDAGVPLSEVGVVQRKLTYSVTIQPRRG